MPRYNEPPTNREMEEMSYTPVDRQCNIPMCDLPARYGVKDDKSNGVTCLSHATDYVWLWLGKELGEDFKALSEMRSLKEEIIEEGTTIYQLLGSLAQCYPPIAQDIFDPKVKKVNPQLLVNYNDKLISPYVVQEQVLKDGDKITILPVYVGG